MIFLLPQRAAYWRDGALAGTAGGISQTAAILMPGQNRTPVFQIRRGETLSQDNRPARTERHRLAIQSLAVGGLANGPECDKVCPELVNRHHQVTARSSDHRQQNFCKKGLATSSRTVSVYNPREYRG
ncbi:hypothetical protein PAF17_09310 [Paracoccus sp. Z330]|uniref:Uncharacterized protein n=1 Tax=Paracoccus onchidii TaxID=3017813 RepID=A0ABT4ZEM2_9RHOB|nr:hypothetical protein [Paracoccus onchidii]MDB6177709.1 hypothetical protein [Paracoccus onchidii]